MDRLLPIVELPRCRCRGRFRVVFMQIHPTVPSLPDVAESAVGLHVAVVVHEVGVVLGAVVVRQLQDGHALRVELAHERLRAVAGGVGNLGARGKSGQEEEREVGEVALADDRHIQVVPVEGDALLGVLVTTAG
eukprot:1370769-Pyramimonas_sp.AAC.1